MTLSLPTPATPGSPAGTNLVASVVAELNQIYNTQNATLVAAYKAAVAASSQTTPAPAPPTLTIVNSTLAAQLETSAEAGIFPTVAQWQAVLSTYVYPVIPIVPLAPYTIGTQQSNGLYALTASGPWPSDGQQFVVNGQDYVAVWASPFGPVYAAAI